jgi:holo-[acyl-carrier protein] synthase
MKLAGVGLDVVDVARMSRAIERERFVSRVFTDREIAWARGKPDAARRFAACFAAKEAFFKAVGSGWPRGGKLTEVELLHKGGSPSVEVTGVARDILEGRRIARVEVTSSREGDHALCLVLLLRAE